MHELGITQTIVDTVTQHAKGAKVQRVSLEIGKLAAIMPDAVHFCFDVCTRGTPLEGATLDIIEIPGLARCRQCGAEVHLDEPFGICDCGSVELDVISGQELKIKEMEVELCA
ncbi:MULTISPECIES: hydrogenase maturation nickel metallochaperone HypA [unclassified Coleofasciculus]|uniref:hydrogenase maturation nickel metallochaperone HypA/HybF n=1 Tax=unclassified Coleofasciculus TaxID=2692782 RepID=UPI00187ED0B7|nr:MULTISPECIES: hydrogenase maturation nickel metallochaperone HypA [unclassified Coleofasciculus]MBE9129580.1 hydrogenase maturation nickel metallochaperone HypA [Coleofasciculus sp. LEGE 07081]MBE9148260.1 hydrogenase maturation nickel metallochaperone HypA [Coleofasciculus sp. LEGE 07092]